MKNWMATVLASIIVAGCRQATPAEQREQARLHLEQQAKRLMTTAPEVRFTPPATLRPAQETPPVSESAPTPAPPPATLQPQPQPPFQPPPMVTSQDRMYPQGLAAGTQPPGTAPNPYAAGQ